MRHFISLISTIVENQDVEFISGDLRIFSTPASRNSEGAAKKEFIFYFLLTIGQ